MHDEHPFSRAYRDAMARFAGHVQIVTTASGGAMRGVTATACCSVSDDPPTVLACVNRFNPKNEIFLESGNFALNTLGARHKPLSDAFSGLGGLSTEERFAMGDWSFDGSGAPVLNDALASFDCRLVEAKEMSTHWILIGEVVKTRCGDEDEALMYYRRAYRTL
ncbi:flavin reductase family protein [Martelella radicis]|uniref:Cob(II)yrinic acid a,c-diamide reductase n=1 Tax=Martelella radicis TaxID=1397476 RepID=A0A7W6P9S0_9HYPH|nr:flavin reductase family protein [Martelella radicis]MBB4121676.1 cob(II)yrinic acid a,c-diamide reductase [Martelella radicis]